MLGQTKVSGKESHTTQNWVFKNCGEAGGVNEFLICGGFKSQTTTWVVIKTSTANFAKEEIRSW